MYEHEIRTQIAHEHIAQLRLDMSPASRRRRLLLHIPFRLGRLTPEPKARCREASSRA